MSSSQSRSDRPTRQDYVARIRYVNNLPPPPIPPKFLNIPGTGLPNDHYTSASYASRLVRDQPINIGADADLGMPIDLVGMPGVFDGDESSISAMPNPPPPHPHDEPLLKPLSALRRADTASVSFLRKTDYVGSGSGSLQIGQIPRRLGQHAHLKRKHEEISSEDPTRITRDIERSFALANGEAQLNGDAAAEDSARENWANPKHPSKPHLELLDSYPILPDIDATPDTGSYSVTKYSTNPADAARSYNSVETAILLPKDPNAQKMQIHRDAQNDRIAKGQNVQPPPFNYELFLANTNAVDGIRQARNEPDSEETLSFVFRHQRSYETTAQSGNADEPFNDMVALALYDGEDAEGSSPTRKLSKGAYFYPIGARNNIRTERAQYPYQGLEVTADVLDTTFRSPTAEELQHRQERQTVYETPAAQGAA